MKSAKYVLIGTVKPYRDEDMSEYEGEHSGATLSHSCFSSKEKRDEYIKTLDHEKIDWQSYDLSEEEYNSLLKQERG